ncbi:MAG: AI-2E family transporter [Myxococcota bacterium]
MFPPDRFEPRVITWLRNPRVRRTFILAGLWLFVAGLLVAYRGVLLPFGLALLFAFVMEPAVAHLSDFKLKGRRMGRPVAIIGIYVVVLSVMVLFSIWAVAQIGLELTGLGKLSARMVSDLKGGIAWVLDGFEAFASENALPLDRSEVEAALQQNLAGAVENAADSATELFSFGRELIGQTFEIVFGSFLVLMLTAFLSADRRLIERFVETLIPPEWRNGFETIRSGVSTGLSGVVRGQILICLTNGVLTFLGLWLLSVKLPLILGLLAAAFSLIPIFGSIISTIPIVAMALLDGFSKAFFALLWIIGIHLLEGNVLNPKILGDSAKIHPVVVIFALIVGERTGGLIGALFAVPIAAIIQTIFLFMRRRALAGFETEDVTPTMDLPIRELEETESSHGSESGLSSARGSGG